MWDPTLDPHALAARIDHTLLTAGATEEEVRLHARQARSLGVAGACVAPCWVPLLGEVLHGTAVKVVTVIGFPLGASVTAVKVREVEEAARQGADELDAEVHLGHLRAGRLDAVLADLVALVETADGLPVKAILETGLLDANQVRRAAETAERAGAAFVKTSTGFGPGGATVETVRLLRQVVGDRLGVKASGGIRTLGAARAMVGAGADRLGTSSTAEILGAARDS